MASAASQAGDADSSRAPGLTSGLQGSVNVHRGALLLVTGCNPNDLDILDGLVSFRVTVCCVQKCGARMVICKLMFVLIWLANF